MENQVMRLDRQLSYKELITRYLNQAKARLIANLIDLQMYKSLEITEPTYVSQGADGRPVKLADSMKAAKQAARIARDNVARMEKMLKMEEDGKLAELYTDDMLIDPLDQLEESKKK